MAWILAAIAAMTKAAIARRDTDALLMLLSMTVFIARAMPTYFLGVNLRPGRGVRNWGKAENGVGRKLSAQRR